MPSRVRAPVGRRSRGDLIFLILLNACSPTIADDTITNVMSPVVSFQYLEAPGEAGSTLMSPVVSYQHFDSLGDAVSWQSESSPTVSYFYQIGSEPAPVLLHGRLTDTAGAALPGATVTATVGLTPVAQVTTDASGAYQLPSLGAGVYVLTANAAGHQNSLRALTLSAATAQQDFQLAALPAAPTVQQTSRQPPSSFTQPPTGPLGATLKVFDGTAFVAITPANAPSPNLMTIVLTHGWVLEVLGVEFVKGIEGWPTEMATQLLTNGVSPAVANIVAWDWRYAAEGALPPEENTPEQGVALGGALQAALGAGYAQPVHFLGHSLGTMVNAAAINYLHGDRTAQQEVSKTPWSRSPTYVTLFDQAEIARVAGVQVLFDGLTTEIENLSGSVKVTKNALEGWKPSSPVHFDWMDNYISLVGFYNPAALNVALQKAEGYAGLEFWQAHSYPMQWYRLSIARPTDSLLGFQRSREYVLANRQPAESFPPAVSVLSPGDAYHQDPGSSDPLALEPLPPENLFQTIVPFFGNGADAVVQGVVAPIQIAGLVSPQIEAAAGAVGAWVANAFNFIGNSALQGSQALVSLWDSATLRLTLQSSPPSPLKGGGGSPPMAWLPLAIPTNAAAMAFDFTVAGDPVDDVIVCGIGTNNLFSLQAKYVPTNAVSASRLMDVTAWAGATNELFFGLMGGTSTNATLQVEDIRFFSLQPPQLQITSAAGGTVRLTWPATAGGYVVQTATSLAPADWTVLTNAPTLTADRYTLTNGVGDTARFFRLRTR